MYFRYIQCAFAYVVLANPPRLVTGAAAQIDGSDEPSSGILHGSSDLRESSHVGAHSLSPKLSDRWVSATEELSKIKFSSWIAVIVCFALSIVLFCCCFFFTVVQTARTRTRPTARWQSVRTGDSNARTGHNVCFQASCATAGLTARKCHH
jgi:hypothetical protein